MVGAEGDARIGMIKARRLFNDLHVKLADESFSEVRLPAHQPISTQPTHIPRCSWTREMRTS